MGYCCGVFYSIVLGVVGRVWGVWAAVVGCMVLGLIGYGFGFVWVVFYGVCGWGCIVYFFLS